MADSRTARADTFDAEDAKGSRDSVIGGTVADFPRPAQAFHPDELAIIPANMAKKIAERKMGNLFRIAPICRL